MNAGYNEVPGWDYGELFKAFSPRVPAKAFKITTGLELDKLLDDATFQSATYPQVCTIPHCETLLKYISSATIPLSILLSNALG